jgi:hypothetical protein
MKTKACLLILITILIGGCFAPVNLTYDSAKTLNKGQIEVQGMYSRYNVTNDTLSSALINQNYGISLGYGITDRYTMKIRYEYIDPTVTFQKVFGDISEDFKGMNSMSYFEVNNKLMLVKNNLTLGLPVGAYFYNTKMLDVKNGGMGWFTFDPRLYITFFRSTKFFELSVVPKLHCLFGAFGGYVTPGISLGMGLSSNLDKWAFRPEIGYDKYLSFGAGLNFNFNTIKPAAAGTPAVK